MSEPLRDAPDDWRRLALHPPRAHGEPPGTAVIRARPEDFIVDEQLGFEPAGAGPHALLRVRKRGANTDWVARQLANVAGVRPMDVGFAGLKDRHAVTTQWFTVPLERAPAERRRASDWQGLAGEDYEVLEAHAHHRKLPRGALDANRFELTLRDWQGDGAQLEQRLRHVAREGVPNYFGPQRFGRGLSNLAPWVRPPEAGQRWRLGEYPLSAGRSLLFNAVLARRVELGTWNRLQAGDLANLDGRGSIFAVETIDEDLLTRAAAQDLHPTGPMWGDDQPATAGEVRALEDEIAAGFPTVPQGLASVRMASARRPLRLAVRELEWTFEADDVVRVSFLLRAGGYATTVLRELIQDEPISAA
jgi:tRNA pseudouridine13 synthase